MHLIKIYFTFASATSNNNFNQNNITMANEKELGYDAHLVDSPDPAAAEREKLLYRLTSIRQAIGALNPNITVARTHSTEEERRTIVVKMHSPLDESTRDVLEAHIRECVDAWQAEKQAELYTQQDEVLSKLKPLL